MPAARAMQLRNTIKPLFLFTLFACSALACTSAPAEDDETASTEQGVGSCATSAPDGAGGVWLNFPANEIGCPNETWVNANTRLPAWYDGNLMQGRIRCGYEWLRANQPDVFQALGQVSSNETHYFSPDGFDAWYNQFSSGSKVQFEWRGPCADTGHGFVKFYVVPCQFQASTRPGGLTYESPGCGTTIDETHGFDGSITFTVYSRGNRGVVRYVKNGDAYVPYLSEGDFRTVQIGLAQLRRSQQYGRVTQKPGAPINWNCVGASLGAIGAGATTLITCMVPAPTLVACGPTIALSMSAGAWVIDACK